MAYRYVNLIGAREITKFFELISLTDGNFTLLILLEISMNLLILIRRNLINHNKNKKPNYTPYRIHWVPEHIEIPSHFDLFGTTEGTTFFDLILFTYGNCTSFIVIEISIDLLIVIRKKLMNQNKFGKPNYRLNKIF